MLASEKNVEILSDFGLTRNQAKVYMAVAQFGLASVGQISRLSKVRREDVYRILPKLEKIGLVERLLGTPVKVRATSVEGALSILIKHEQDVANQKISSLKARKETFLKHFKPTTMKPKLGEEPNFALLSERDQILGKSLNMLRKVKRELDIVCSRTKLMQLIHNFAQQLKGAAQKHVKIRIISELPEHEDLMPRILEEYVSPGTAVDLRYSDIPSGHYMIVDLREALMATTTEGNLADNPCLWTSNISLVRMLQGNFESLWHNSMSWEIVETTAVPEKVTRFIEQLRPTNHVIFVYDSQEAKYNVLFNYLKVGLENGEAGVYVTTDEEPSQVREGMKRFGIDVEKYEKRGALEIFEYDRIYIIDGKFSPAVTINLWNNIYNEALKKGLTGLRVTGEMSCFFKHNLVQELVEYEKALHRILDIPMIAICAYDAKTLNTRNDAVNLYTELVRAHGTVLFTGVDQKLGRIEIRKG